MNKKFLFIYLLILLAGFLIGWLFVALQQYWANNGQFSFWQLLI